MFFYCFISHFLHQILGFGPAGRTSSLGTHVMHQHAVGDEVGVEVLDVEVVHGDRLVQLLQLQPRHNPRVAGDGLDAVSYGQVARRNPALVHNIERVAGRRVDDAPARLDVQELVVLPDEDLFDFLQRPLAGLDVVGQGPPVKLGAPL